MGTRPMVHKGFWRSWSSHGVRSRVLDTIARVMAAQGRLAQRMEVRLTGEHHPSHVKMLGIVTGVCAHLSHAQGIAWIHNAATKPRYKQALKETWCGFVQITGIP